jgi:hypothetical protein
LTQQEEDSGENYEEKLTTLSDIELIREQSENFVELMFFQIQLEAENEKNRRSCDDLKPMLNFESSIAKVEGKILSVKKEINRRDEMATSRLSLLRQAIEQSKVVILSVELLRESIEKREMENCPEKINATLDHIAESAKESARLMKEFAQLNIAKGDWAEVKIAELSK